MRSLKKPPTGKRAKPPRRAEWRDHALKGSWALYCECHIGGDFLLIYRIDDADRPSGTVYFARAGTHAQLFD